MQTAFIAQSLVLTLGVMVTLLLCRKQAEDLEHARRGGKSQIGFSRIAIVQPIS